MALSKQKIFFTVLLLFLCFFILCFTTNTEANSGPLSAPKSIIDRAVSSNHNNPNVIIVKRSDGFYSTIAHKNNVGLDLPFIYKYEEGNDRIYSGTSGQYLHGEAQSQFGWNWWSHRTDLYFQWTGWEIVYNYLDIMNEDGTIFLPAHTHEFVSPVILNTDDQLSTLDFDLLDIKINDAKTSPFYLYLLDRTENDRPVLILDLYRDYEEYIQRMELDNPLSPLIFRIPIGVLPRFSYQQGHTYNWQLQPALGEDNVDRVVLSTVDATGGGSSGDGRE